MYKGAGVRAHGYERITRSKRRRRVQDERQQLESVLFIIAANMKLSSSMLIQWQATQQEGKSEQETKVSCNG